MTKFYLYRNKKILLLGLENSGKTATLSSLILEYKLSSSSYKALQSKNNDKTTKQLKSSEQKFGDFNLRTIYLNYRNYNLWDLSGHPTARNFWKCYFDHCRAIIYVINSVDDRYSSNIKCLELLLKSPELENVVFLVFFRNVESDLKNDNMEVDIGRIMGKRTYKIIKRKQADENFYNEGFLWLTQQI